LPLRNETVAKPGEAKTDSEIAFKNIAKSLDKDIPVSYNYKARGNWIQISPIERKQRMTNFEGTTTK
jgi:hypothetical protein